MPVMLENAGITGSHQQLLLNALNTVFSFISGIVGSFFVDRWGRRTLFLYGTFLTGLIYIPINVIASFEPAHITTRMGYGFIACIFLYGILFAFSWTPLQSLYPAEILPNRVRAKGMALQNVATGGANFINMYATPTGMDNIGWRMYTIFCEFPVALVPFSLVMELTRLPGSSGTALRRICLDVPYSSGDEGSHDRRAGGCVQGVESGQGIFEAEGGCDA